MRKYWTRRGFLKTSGAAAIGIGLAADVLGGETATAPSDRINIGTIGYGGRGRGHTAVMLRHKDTRVTAICDVDKRRVKAGVAASKGTATGYHDFRKLIDHKDLDAVIVATPPHWHTLQAVAACKAGKDLFIEKPLTITPGESQAIVKAAKENKSVTQVCTQIHAGENYHRVVEIVRSGILGRINAVRTFFKLGQTRRGIGKAPNSPPPPYLDWEMYVGPARMRPYNRLLNAGAAIDCSFMEFTGGWMPGMAPHIIDLPVWALELGLPSRASCTGGRFVLEGGGNEPDVQEAQFQYPDLTVTWMMNLTNSYGWDFQGNGGRTRRLGVYFHGDQATLYANYGMFKIIPEGNPKAQLKLPEKTLPRSPGHHEDWIRCIKSRKQPSCNVFYHHNVNMPIALANLSMKLGRSIQIDPKTGDAIGDEKAARAFQPKYRKPWKLG